MAKRDSRGRFVKKTRAKRRTTTRRRAKPKAKRRTTRRTTRSTSRRRAAPKRRRTTARKTTRRRRSTATTRRRPTYRTRTRSRRRTRSNPPKFKLMNSAVEVVKLGAYAVGGYATVGLAAYAVDHVGLAKWKAEQLQKSPETNVIKIADVVVRLVASIGLGYAAHRLLKDKKCAAAVMVGGAFNAVHSAVEHFVLDTETGRKLPESVQHALAGYDGYSTLYDAGALQGTGVDGYQQQGVGGYQQMPRIVQQAERAAQHARAVVGAY